MSVPSMFELQTLGGLDLRARDGAELRGLLAQPKRLALLIYLAVAQPRGFHRRDTLLALFWPELDQGRARAALRKAVLVVRQGLGPGALVGRGDEELGLADGVVSCDAIGFERAVGERRFGDALDLYRGDLLEGFFIAGAPEFALDFTPKDESALRRLITLFYRMGDRAAALRAYNEFAARLLEECGVRPSAETRQLVEVVKQSGELRLDVKRGRPAG